ncbi:hypothetical protein LEN26_002140 [Aphanomyces euteiches]|nr:hypothetical protein AeMF1_004054 [Aphanomyces euteiches]KAH9159844.1 hypothetical protein LEN26_002140 [Aphanomyces euteiches]
MDEEGTKRMQCQDEGQVIYKIYDFQGHKVMQKPPPRFCPLTWKATRCRQEDKWWQKRHLSLVKSHAMLFQSSCFEVKEKEPPWIFCKPCGLKNHGCTGHACPTCRQISELEVTQAALTANPKAFAGSLIGQVRQTKAIECSQRMMYLVQAKITEENLGGYKENFTKVELLLEELKKANPRPCELFERDHEGRYKRALLSNPFLGETCQAWPKGSWDRW